MSEAYGGIKDSKTQFKEHVDVGGVGAKRVLLSGFDGTNINDVNITPDGAIITADGMSIPAHDKLVIDTSTPNVTVFTYSKSGTTVATKTITEATNTVTIEVT
jgi:hypothetical protein